MSDDFGAWLREQKCAALVPCRCWDCAAGRTSPCPGQPQVCGAPADHSQNGKRVCNRHLDPNVRAFALND